ncbi:MULTISPECIES: hypothetical protein [Bacillus]|uniref:hypothetical protein n=1 Tax=Bacillus TaxID=1386 RepID=UPI0008FB7CA4|nr:MULTISPECIES: hypothetical protein [Bacillus]ARC72568.1 hypothetical protein B37_00515 [Bacillus licheniformis]ARW41703.1 hypothetical protein S100141_00380 [Bacillus licheniformis]ARW56553.1 hypothetical protein S100027_04589 [Bacillus licheniformis]AXF87822.1 hypothetical protein BLDA23_05855 [Bacillus licheniformis]MCA1182465.1 hypothetical protein [Bacillus licheniformis]
MNKVAFYYRKDLNVTKHGEFKAAVNMLQGDAVKRNDVTGQAEIAANSDEFEGVVDVIRYNVQGNDTLDIEAGERVRVGVGKDFEIVVKGNHPALDALNKGAEVGVANGKFVAVDGTDVTVAVGKLVEKFISGEKVVRIY